MHDPVQLDFARRRQRNLWSMLPAVALGGVTLLTWPRDAPTGALPPLLWLTVAAALGGAAWVHLVNWRCPACKAWLGRNFAIRACPRCKVRLRP